MSFDDYRDYSWLIPLLPLIGALALRAGYEAVRANWADPSTGDNILLQSRLAELK